MAIHKGKPTKDGRKYYFTKYKNGVNHTSKKYMTADECKKAESMFILKNDSPINKRFDLVADEYFDNLLKYLKVSTVDSYKLGYKRHILPYFEKKYINKINVSDIIKWAEILEKNNYKVSYKNKLLGTIKGIFNFAIKNYNLENNPAIAFGTFKQKKDSIIDNKKKIKHISFEDFNKFISVIDDIMWKAFFITAFYTGCRKGEIIALNWNDIDFENSEIEITKTLYTRNNGKPLLTSPKTNKNRKIKMSQVLKTTLLEYKKHQMQYTDFETNWFVFGGPHYLALTTIDRYKEKYFKLAAVDEITMHEFRHSHVTMLANEYIKKCEKLDLKVDTAKFFLMLSNRMGHSLEVMQRTYMELFPTVQDEIIDLLDNMK